MYKDLGRKLGERLWNETMKEYDLVKVEKAMDSVRK